MMVGPHIVQVSNWLRERVVGARRDKQQAAALYAELLLSREPAEGAASQLLAAVDALGIKGEDLWSDAQAIEAVNRLGEQLTQAEKLRNECADALRHAELGLHEAQSTFSHGRIIVAHERVAEAQEAHLDADRHASLLRSEWNVAKIATPRVYSQSVACVQERAPEAEHAK